MCNYQHARQKRQQQQRRRMKSSEVGKKLNGYGWLEWLEQRTPIKCPSGIALYRFVEHGLLFTERANCFSEKKKKAKRNEDPKPGYNTLLDIYALFARLVEFEMLWFYFAAKYLCVNCFFGRSILNGNSNTNFLHFFAAFWCAEWLKRLWWWCNARACAFVLISKWLTIVGIFGNIFL